MNTFFYQHRLLVFITAALLLDFIPYVKLPLVWSETFFHEISHGLAAMLTGGRIISITLDFVGSGLCVSQGGIRFIVAFAGYFGSALWGMLIYLIADNIKPKTAFVWVGVFILMMAITLVLWAKGISTYIILTGLIVLFSLFYKFSSSHLLKYVLQFLGIFVLLDAIRSPLVLIDGQSRGDGATLASITYVPEFIWVGIWFAIGLSCLYFIYRMTYQKKLTSRFI